MTNNKSALDALEIFDGCCRGYKTAGMRVYVMTDSEVEAIRAAITKADAVEVVTEDYFDKAMRHWLEQDTYAKAWKSFRKRFPNGVKIEGGGK